MNNVNLLLNTLDLNKIQRKKVGKNLTQIKKNTM